MPSARFLTAVARVRVTLRARHGRSARAVGTSLCSLILFASQSACTTTDLKRMTYEMLAQQDCVRNQLDDFCSRGYTHEYEEYERVRLDYLRHIADETNDNTPALP